MIGASSENIRLKDILSVMSYEDKAYLGNAGVTKSLSGETLNSI